MLVTEDTKRLHCRVVRSLCAGGETSLKVSLNSWNNLDAGLDIGVAPPAGPGGGSVVSMRDLLRILVVWHPADDIVFFGRLRFIGLSQHLVEGSVLLMGERCSFASYCHVHWPLSGYQCSSSAGD